MVKTHNVSTRYFQSQKKSDPKQARWKGFQAEFGYILEYNPGKGKIGADPLSRKAELSAITTSHCDIQYAIKDGMQHDPKAKKLMEFIVKGKTRHFWVDTTFLSLPVEGYTYPSSGL